MTGFICVFYGDAQQREARCCGRLR